MTTNDCDDSAALVLGVGNLLWGDEGLGPTVVQTLAQDNAFPSVDFVDGGTQGLYLLPILTQAKRVILIDAIDVHQPPGTIIEKAGQDIFPMLNVRKLSLHQATLYDLLTSAYLIDWKPQALVLFGVQIQDCENWGGGLSEPVKAAVPKLLTCVRNRLCAWGFAAAT